MVLIYIYIYIYIWSSVYKLSKKVPFSGLQDIVKLILYNPNNLFTIQIICFLCLFNKPSIIFAHAPMKQHLRLTVYNPLLPLFREHMFKHSILFNHQLNVLLSNLSSYLRC